MCPDNTYVADPIHGFFDHSRGNTVDVTLIDKEGKEIVVNSCLLQETMLEAGFIPYEDEWWHFSDTEVYEPEKNFLYYQKGDADMMYDICIAFLGSIPSLD